MAVFFSSTGPGILLDEESAVSLLRSACFEFWRGCQSQDRRWLLIGWLPLVTPPAVAPHRAPGQLVRGKEPRLG